MDKEDLGAVLQMISDNKELQAEFKKDPDAFVKKHLEPTADGELSEEQMQVASGAGAINAGIVSPNLDGLDSDLADWFRDEWGGPIY